MRFVGLLQGPRGNKAQPMRVRRFKAVAPRRDLYKERKEPITATGPSTIFLITAAGGHGNKDSYQVFFGTECLFSFPPATVMFLHSGAAKKRQLTVLLTSVEVCWGSASARGQ